MDNFLQCRELLDSVCSELSDDSKSLHSLLLTSRLFVEAALDALWREIFFEEPFAACLPEDTFRRKDAPALPRKFILVPNPDRQLTVSDLRRFQSYYAPRIRAIEPGGRGKYHFTPEFLQALIDITDGQHGALAPRLNRFTWDYGFIDSTHFLQYTTLLVGECVTSFRCSNSLRSRTLLRIVTSVTDRLPNLKILSLQLEHACSPFIEDLIKSNSLSSVRSLVIEGISFTAIPVLASLPQLEALKVLALEERSPQNDPRDPWASNSGHFAALRQLYIRCHDISTALNFLRHIPPLLRVFDCTCRTSALEPSLSPQAILDVIVGHISRHSLEVLKIRVGSENTRTTEVGDDTAAAGIDINSLFEFTNLRRVTLHLAGRIQVSPSEVQRIVTAWTQLESLKLYGTLNIPRVALINETHLLTIAEGCPNLRELGVPFDGRHIQCSKRSANGPFPCVKTLHVAWSLDGYPSCREASFFTCNFPSAKLAWYF